MNSTNRYGIVTKFFHWAIFLFFLNQYVVARIMLNTGNNELSLGFTQGALYNWHKSIGLIALAVIFFRYVWRRTTRLPAQRLPLCNVGRLWRPLFQPLVSAQPPTSDGRIGASRPIDSSLY